MTIKARTIKDKQRTQMYQIMTTNYLNTRRRYLKENNKTIMDDTPFQEFTVDCIGKVIPPHVEFQEKVEKRKKQNRPYVWKYKPEENKKESGEINFVFPNTSGNAINNVKNLKLQ